MYPFKHDLVAEEHRRLTELFSSFPAFEVRGERTAWFGDSVVFVEPVGPGPFIALTEAVEATFPAYRAYGGIFTEVVPHLTIGHDQPPDVLRAAERAVLARLPFRQWVDHVELWSGPALATAPAQSWRRVRTYPLGDPPC